MQHQQFRSPTAGGHVWNLNSASTKWIHASPTSVSCCCGAATLHIPDNSRVVEGGELLWGQYFRDATLWWDCWKDLKSSWSLDCNHKEPHRLNNLYKPCWVDAQLTLLGTRTEEPAENRAISLLGYDIGAATVQKSLRYESVQALMDLCENGQLRRAIEALTALTETQYYVPTSLLYRVIQRCAAEKNLVLGQRLDDVIVKLGYKSNAFLGNHILRMYASQGRLQEAMKVFTRVPKPNAFMWSSIISAQSRHGKVSEAIQMYHDMRSAGVDPDGHVIVAALHACAKAEDVESGRKVHADILECGIHPDSFVCSCLVDMYSKCGKLDDARKVFDSMASRNAVTWTAMINGYSKHGFGKEALTLYESMEQEGLIVADSVTYACLLKACASTGALQHGKQLHSQIVERRLLEGDVVMGTCLVNMYAKCGKLDDARVVFDCLTAKDLMTWNAMINGYAEHGFGQQALTLYASLEQEGLRLADRITFACLLKACASTGALQQGRDLHRQILERGLLEGDVVVGTCLVNMYAKCGKLEDARKVFDSLKCRNAVTWTAMITGYAEHGFAQHALTLYGVMEDKGLILADCVTFACLLRACASAGALQQGRQLHLQIVERGLLEGDVSVGNCLVNMYAKCGKLDVARMVFDSLSTKDVVTWTAMISGYGTDNDGRKAIACFEEMMLAGVQPDDTTFTCLLAACSHEGLVSKGQEYFDAMMKQHYRNPTIEHYNCMVDLLGRAGHIEEAEKLLLSVGYKSNDVGLMSLLYACRSHGDIARGTRCFESLLELDAKNAAAYVLMANMYADADRWAEVDRIERLRKLAGASKKPALAGIEVAKQVHTFVVGEERNEVSCKVRSTNVRLREEGNHSPNTKLVLKPLSEKEKEDELCGHAEKLALAYGLLNTPDGSPLLVTKNLRMCRDCHSSTEIMSRVEKRDIVVRDAYRVHRFEGGSCSCKGRH